MHSLRVCLVLAALPLVVHGDVTVQHSVSMTPGPAMPPEAASQFQKQMKSFGGSTRLEIKGSRARSSGMGVTSIIDFEAGTIVLVDAPKRRYARANRRQFVDAVAAQMPKKKADEGETPELLMETTSKKTGKTRDIKGIQAEETEVVLKARIAGMQFDMQTVLTTWSPTASEAKRHAALLELTAYSHRAWDGAEMTGTLQSMLRQVPGSGGGMARFIETIQDTGFVLEMTAKTSMPGMIDILRRAKRDAAGQFSEGTADVMFIMNQTLDEISTAELPESIFSVPQGYSVIDLKELIGQMMPDTQTAPR